MEIDARTALKLVDLYTNYRTHIALMSCNISDRTARASSRELKFGIDEVTAIASSDVAEAIIERALADHRRDIEIAEASERIGRDVDADRDECLREEDAELLAA